MPATLRPLALACLAALAVAACKPASPPPATSRPAPAATSAGYAATHAGDYALVPLRADLSRFDEQGKRMIAKLVQAADVMNDLYWKQSWDGDRAALLDRAPMMPRARWWKSISAPGTASTRTPH
jgi:hypothetical protein